MANKKDRKPRRPAWKIDRENIDRLRGRLQFEMKERMYLTAVTDGLSPEEEKIAFRDAVGSLDLIENYLSPPDPPKGTHKERPGDNPEPSDE